jgi:hypothetical protein
MAPGAVPLPRFCGAGFIDTPSVRLKLTSFRGELREELRDRHLFLENRGDPLNLIRVMPAKGRKLLAKSRPNPVRDRIVPQGAALEECVDE